MSKTIAEQLNVIDFPFEIKDKQGRVIYFEKSDKYWVKTEYDSSNNIKYWQDSNGGIIDKRPKDDVITLNGKKYKRIEQ